MNPILTEALSLIADGVPVFPVGLDKNPVTKNGRFDKSIDPEQIKVWFTNGTYKLAYHPADIDCVVLDCDIGYDPADLEGLPITYTVRTPSGGFHLWFRTNCQFSNRKWAPHIDVRSANGYVVAYPSPGYEICRGCSEPADFPEWAEKRLGEATAAVSVPIEDNEPASEETCERAWEWICRQSEHTDGWIVACKLVRDFGLSQTQAVEIWDEWQEPFAQQWDTDLILIKLNNALNYGREEPGRDAAPNGSSALAFNGAGLTWAQTGGTWEMTEWVWPGWLAKGAVHILAGRAGDGKSTITFSLAATVSSGGKWPDGTHCEPGDVFIWSDEDSWNQTVLPRYTASGGILSRIHRPPPGFDPSTDMDELIEAVLAMKTVKLVVIDPVVMMARTDSHKNAETRRDLRPLVRLAETAQVPVLGITHFTKGTQGRDPLDRITGTLAFGALSRVALATYYDEESGDRRLVRIKSNLGPSGGGFEYRMEQAPVADSGFTAQVVRWGKAIVGSGHKLTTPEKEPAELMRASVALRAWLEEAGGTMMVKELREAAEAHGLSWRTIERAKAATGILAKKNVGQLAGWRWDLPKS